MPALRVHVRLCESIIGLVGPWLSLHKMFVLISTRDAKTF